MPGDHRSVSRSHGSCRAVCGATPTSPILGYVSSSSPPSVLTASVDSRSLPTNRKYRSWNDRAGRAPMRHGRFEGDGCDERSTAS